MPKTVSRTSPSEVEQRGTIENHDCPIHLHWQSKLLRKHRVLLVSAAEDVGEEVEDFVFLEHG